MMIQEARVALGLLSVALLLSGCRDAAAPPPISVVVSPTNASVTAATAQSFSATVVHDASNAGVNWTLTGPGCSAFGCGNLSAASSASGDAVSYYAPATVPTPPTVTVTAVSVTDNTKFGTAAIDITPPAISVSVTPTVVDVAASAQQQFAATAANDPQNAGINWTVTGSGCSGATCGTLSATHSASGAPITYTAPATWPNPANVTITATSITDNTRFAAATVTITSLIVVSVTPTAAHVDVNAPQQLTATL